MSLLHLCTSIRHIVFIYFNTILHLSCYQGIHRDNRVPKNSKVSLRVSVFRADLEAIQPSYLLLVAKALFLCAKKISSLKMTVNIFNSSNVSKFSEVMYNNNVA